MHWSLLLRKTQTVMRISHGIGRRGLCTAQRQMSGRRVSRDLRVEDWHGSSKEVAKSIGLMPRDLRLLATRGANLAARQKYFIFRFPPFTGVVTSEHAPLIPDNGRADAGGAGYTRNLVRLATDVLERSVLEGRGGGYQASVPFEHRVLEAALREDTVRKQERFARLSQQMMLALAVRDRCAHSSTVSSSLTLTSSTSTASTFPASTVVYICQRGAGRRQATLRTVGRHSIA